MGRVGLGDGFQACAAAAARTVVGWGDSDSDSGSGDSGRASRMSSTAHGMCLWSTSLEPCRSRFEPRSDSGPSVRISQPIPDQMPRRNPEPPPPSRAQPAPRRTREQRAATASRKSREKVHLQVELVRKGGQLRPGVREPQVRRRGVGLRLDHAVLRERGADVAEQAERAGQQQRHAVAAAHGVQLGGGVFRQLRVEPGWAGRGWGSGPG